MSVDEKLKNGGYKVTLPYPKRPSRGRLSADEHDA